MKVPPLIPWWLVAATVGVIAAAILVTIGGCATLDHGWRQAHAPSVKPWFYVTVDDAETVCRMLGADAAHKLDTIYGCTIWKPQGCEIYIPSNAPAWLVEHEQHHCAGFSHY